MDNVGALSQRRPITNNSRNATSLFAVVRLRKNARNEELIRLASLLPVDSAAFDAPDTDKWMSFGRTTNSLDADGLGAQSPIEMSADEHPNHEQSGRSLKKIVKT